MEGTEREIDRTSGMQPFHFILDVDGVLTDGTFYYSVEGKVMKRFGADDNDALKFIEDKMSIHVISGDHRGFEITKKRVVDDMGLKLDFVSTNKRIEWISERYDLQQVIYMGDGFFDHLVFKKVFYGIAPANALPHVQQYARFVTQKRGGEGAVAEACMHIDNFLVNNFAISKIW